MGMSSLQVCIDESDWLQVQQQGSINPEDNIGILDQTSPITSPSGEDMLACSRPLMERRLRPPHEQSLKCPRCESTHTKFCYYNNYSLSQPRYFCKTCRRYWTKGGTLRNIPVGGGCRKNKKQVSNNSKKQSNESSSTSSPLNIHIHNPQNNNSGLSSPSPAGLLSYHNYNNFETTNQFDHFQTPIDFMENNSYNGHEINFGGLMGGHNYGTNNFNHGICSQFGLMSSTFEHGTNSANYGSNNILESCQKMMVPFDNHTHLDVKPNPEVNLSIDQWQEHQQQQACNSNAGKESFGYNFGGLGSWTGLMNGYGSSATHPLV